MKNSNQLSSYVSAIDSPNCRLNNSCLLTNKKAAQSNHLLHYVLYTKPTPARLKSRQLPRPRLEQLSKETADPLPSPLPLLNQFLVDITTPRGFCFPRKA